MSRLVFFDVIPVFACQTCYVCEAGMYHDQDRSWTHPTIARMQCFFQLRILVCIFTRITWHWSYVRWLQGHCRPNLRPNHLQKPIPGHPRRQPVIRWGQLGAEDGARPREWKQAARHKGKGISKAEWFQARKKLAHSLKFWLLAQIFQSFQIVQSMVITLAISSFEADMMNGCAELRRWQSTPVLQGIPGYPWGLCHLPGLTLQQI